MIKDLCRLYATTRLFYEKNSMQEKCLRIMKGGYNMNMRCYQMFMFWTVVTPSTFEDFHFTARHYLGFSIYYSALGDSHFTARWTEKGRFPTLQQNFRCRRDKKIFLLYTYSIESSYIQISHPH